MLHLSNRLKRLLLVLIILIITGCSAEYNITINDSKDVNESLNVIEDNKELFDKPSEELSGSTLKEYLETDLKWPTPIDVDSETNPLEPTKLEGINYYNKKDISGNLKLGINYNYNFASNKYSKSNIVNECYEYEYNILNNVISFKTTSDFKCFEKYSLLKNAKFNLTTKCHMINSNADKVVDNEYTWNIDKSDKKINFSMDCNYKEKKVKIPIVIIVPIYVLLVGLGMLILKISYKINNKF